MNKARIAIFASGSGSNAEKIIQYFSDHPSIEVVLLLSNNPTAFALARAKNYGVATQTFNRTEYSQGEVMLGWLKEKDVSHIVLAGFLWLIPSYLIQAFPEKIINIHPALLPNFGGKGMFGMKVHEAVKAAGEVETGITIHLVNEKYDDGKVVFQGRCAIDKTCSAEEIAEKVHALEYEHYPKEIERWIAQDMAIPAPIKNQ
jgi:phosphoribosylglycinamide formyltransferase 1